MKMENAEVRFVVFASGDVITTSTITGDDTLVKVIYLTPDSAKNFNLMVPVGSPRLSVGTANYLGYSGQIEDVGETWGYPPGIMVQYSLAGSAETLTAEQRKALYNVSSGNTKEYNAVLSWLSAHKMT